MVAGRAPVTFGETTMGQSILRALLGEGACFTRSSG
jgi:hypothetical protein